MTVIRFAIIAVSFLFLWPPQAAFAFDHSHSGWTTLLHKHVVWTVDGTASQVDYSGFSQDRKELAAYLQSLSTVSVDSFDSWSRDQQLAFLINAYNAYTVELILSKYPDLESIKELGGFFTSPWEKKFFHLLGKERHLDGIEHELIRGSGRYNEPLVHFAVNCASIGCPALRDEAFVAERIEEQLLDQTQRFLADRSRNRFDAGNKVLQVSSIFEWYEEDFTQGWRGSGSLYEFFAIHADLLSKNPSVQQQLHDGKYELDFLHYNWKLNSR